MVRNRWIYSVFIITVISFLTIGYSAFTNQLNIDNLLAYFRAEIDIRITNISVESAEGDAISYLEEYGKETIMSEIELPNENSSVTYRIEVTNFGGTYMVLSDINGLQDNLEYSIDNYDLNNLICDDSNECNLGITKYIYLTIKYKNPPADDDSIIHNINLNFKFTEFTYTINYYPNRKELFNGYRELDYIESTSLQYVTTRIIPTNNTGIYLKIASMNVDDDSIFFGSGTPDGNRFWIGNSSSNIYFGWNDLYSTRLIGDNPIIRDEINVFEMNYMNDRNLKYNNVILASNLDILSEKKLPMMIFAYNNLSTNSYNMPSSIKLYELMVSENNNIVGNFVPCERILDNELGLCDVVLNEFLENEGTQEFLKNDNLSQQFLYGTSHSLKGNIFDNEGYEFVGWNTKPDGSGIFYNDKQEVLNLSNKSNVEINLYAQWTISEYVINFDANTGSGTMDSMTLFYNEPRKLNDNKFEKEGYAFVGWNTKPDGSGVSYTDEEEVINLSFNLGISKIVLYAQWKPIQYKVNFYQNILSIPNEYEELDYIESSGTQHIITEIIPSNNTGIYLKMASMNVEQDRVFLGTGGTSDNNRFWIGNSNGGIYYGWNTLYGRTQIGTKTIKQGEINIFEMNYMNDRELVYNSTTVKSNLPTLLDKNTPLAIFGYNGISGSQVYSKSSIRLYELKISENIDIISHFIPCEKIDNGELGVFDLVTNTFVETQSSEKLKKNEEFLQNFEYNIAKKLTANKFEKEGYRFIGWNTKSDGSGVSYNDEQEVINLTNLDGKNIRLYAQWDKVNS